jgi:uncharacterized RDD family membrane protein YckC
LSLLVDTAGFYALAFTIGIVLAVFNATDVLDDIPDFFFNIGLMLIYYVPFEFITGRTLRKLVTGTKVVAADGKNVTLGKIIGRTFARFIPFEAFSFFGKQTIGWHDSLSGTRVVKCR